MSNLIISALSDEFAVSFEEQLKGMRDFGIKNIEMRFVDGKNVKQPEIIRTLNRLSSALHIMMCMYLAGEYK